MNSIISKFPHPLFQNRKRTKNSAIKAYVPKLYQHDVSPKTALAFISGHLRVALATLYFGKQHQPQRHTISAEGLALLQSPLLRINASATKEIVGEIERFHARHFADSRFTTKELASFPEAKAVVEFLREPLQAVVAFDSNVELSRCEYIISYLETCAVWSIAANTDPATARPFLHTINARAHRCEETLDKVIQQHNLLEQLMQRLTDGAKEYVVESLPLLFKLEHEAPAQDFFSRASSLQSSAFRLSRRLAEWNVRNSAVVGSLSSIREFLAGKSEKLATVAARDDVGFAKDLSVFLENCREEHSSHRCQTISKYKLGSRGGWSTST